MVFKTQELVAITKTIPVELIGLGPGDTSWYVSLFFNSHKWLHSTQIYRIGSQRLRPDLFYKQNLPFFKFFKPIY